MKAYVAIQNFGSTQQKRELCAALGRITALNAHTNDVGIVVIVCDSVAELGEVFAKLANDDATNWIEYTVQFDY